MGDNLYIHFPFCRTRCSYCTLLSRSGVPASERDAYARRIAEDIRSTAVPESFDTVYFGGGTPALCDLAPVFAALDGRLAEGCEFTVELHPLDVCAKTLDTLKAGGVNRISMGVQSFDDSILAHMGRGYTFSEAERAFALVKTRFDNAGIDLIVGYPGETAALVPRHARLAKWGLNHCSVYSLQNERGLENVIDDETTMDRLAITARFLEDIGLVRYEISNYAVPGCECRHNLAVWRGEDYIGLGNGACGRIGRKRTPSGEMLSEADDLKERTIFRLRTREGLDTTSFPQWRTTLDGFVERDLLRREGLIYFLTPRGCEVCDSILAGII